MISLRAVLCEQPSPDNEERSVWKTYGNKWAGRNTFGYLRYFKNQEDAVAFARGNTSGPRMGRPKKAKRAQRAEPIQKYDVTPVTYTDREKTQ